MDTVAIGDSSEQGIGNLVNNYLNGLLLGKMQLSYLSVQPLPYAMGMSVS